MALISHIYKWVQIDATNMWKDFCDHIAFESNNPNVNKFEVKALQSTV